MDRGQGGVMFRRDRICMVVGDEISSLGGAWKSFRNRYLEHCNEISHTTRFDSLLELHM